MGDDDASVVSSSRPTSPNNDTDHDRDTVPPLRRAGAPTPYRFHWDPTVARRQGPASISEATDLAIGLGAETGQGSSSSRIAESLFDAGASSALPSSWSSSKYGFNAISTVLNNPHSRPNPLKSGKAPISSGPSPDLPRIRRKDFDPYLNTILPEWKTFERNRQSIDGSSSVPPHDNAISPELNDESPAPEPEKRRQPPPPLDTVPGVYFSLGFDLANPQTFASVIGAKEGDLRGASTAAFDTQIQERLSHSLDTVEHHLTIEIQARSASFFAALSNLHSLSAEGSECLSRISHLRKELLEVDERQAKRGLHVTRLLKRSDNLGTVQEGVRTIQALGESVGLVKNLVGTGEYFEALGLINQVEDMFKPPSLATKAIEPNPSAVALPRRLSTASLAPPLPGLPLQNLVSLGSLPAQLRDLSTSIATSLSADLVAILRADLTKDLGSSSSSSMDMALHDRLAPLFKGLVSTAGVEEAVKSYRDVALTEIRACVRKHLPPSEWDEEDNAAVGPAAAMAQTDSGFGAVADIKNMSHDEFMTVARTLYAVLLSRIRTVTTHVATITTLLESAPPTATGVPEAETTLPALSTLLSAATELANTRASKLVALRALPHASLPLESFLEVFQASWDFVVECEVIARRMIVGLRGVIVSQAKGWLATFHSQRITEGARAVEEEVWAQVEVGKQSQAVVDLLVQGAMEDPPEFVIGSAKASNGRAPSSPSSVTNGKPVSAKVLKIEEASFFVVAATMQVLELLIDYLKVIVNLPSLTTDAMSRIIEFLKAFNSRTCQVVLGAGAMRSAGLKNITAKHLALASQSLSVMITLIPYVRETFRRHLNSKQAVILVEFDKLKRDYQEHQNEIHSKLIAIMGDRLAVHCKALQEIQWDVPAPGSGPNTYMEVLVKETVTLHKVLSKYLSGPTVELIMSQVFATVTHRLTEEYGKIELPSQEAKTRLLQDAKYLHDKLSGLKNVSIPGSMLETVVMEKTIPRKGSPFPMRRQSTMPVLAEPLQRQPSGLGSPRLGVGMGSSRSTSGTGPGSPAMHGLFSGGAGVGTPASLPPTPTPDRGGRRTPTSPASRSPYGSPRLLPIDMRSGLPTTSSPSHRPPSPLVGALPSQLSALEVAQYSEPNGKHEDSLAEVERPPPTPEKDRRYMLPTAANDSRHDSLLVDRPMSEEPSHLDPVVPVESVQSASSSINGVNRVLDKEEPPDTNDRSEAD
ncbi:hypothetical protein FRB94_011774 [Tulasnella sp. JGI-2019a]|nr:hypothetical protein FRB93_002221 [Tulasnella sp. JGI-2019a]KAG9014596.1 hypothetical protein FRB94_011774 [Tulasnella sp. JGI-2019a]